MSTAVVSKEASKHPPSAEAAVEKTVAIALLHPSKTNPRKTFSGIDELAQSIRTQGLVQPPLVRPSFDKEGHFEIIAGERRWMAAKKAGLAEVKVRVCQMADKDVLQVQIVENLQREDISPLEEAAGYARLKGETGKSIEEIAQEIGKSPSYVYQRIQLNRLAPLPQAFLGTGLITPAHAVIIARLAQPADQLRALSASFEGHDYDPLTEEELDRILTGKNPTPALNPEKDLREFVQGDIHLELKAAPWDMKQEEWPRIKGFQPLGSCAGCAQNTKNAPSLFPELKGSGGVCTNGVCYAAKREAFVQIRTQQASAGDVVQISMRSSYRPIKADQVIFKNGQWLYAAKGSCKNVKTGLYVDGPDAGKNKSVCLDQDCKVHKHHVQGAKKAKRGSAGTVESWEEKRKRQEAAEEREGKIRDRIVAAVLEKVDALGSREVRRVVLALFRETHLWGKDKALAEMVGVTPPSSKGLEGAVESLPVSSPRFAKLAIGLLLADEMRPRETTPKARRQILAFAADYKVDGAAIVKAFEAEETKRELLKDAKALGVSIKKSQAPAKAKGATLLGIGNVPLPGKGWKKVKARKAKKVAKAKKLKARAAAGGRR